jgi:hypothetical protein
MSFNYIIPPRLKASDYAKGKITQDEIIALQIANDANIAAARKAVRLGEVQPLTPQQEASASELLADDAAQEASARANLGRLGFRDQEAAQIITNIRNDADLSFPILNANFPAIESDIKKRFNVKLLTPAFFLEYLRKYSDELAGAAGIRIFAPHNGGFNGLVNTVEELRQVIPEENIIRYIKSQAQSKKIISKEIISELDRFINLIPTQRELQLIEKLPAVEQQRTISQLLEQWQDTYSKEQLRNLAKMIQNNELSNEGLHQAILDIINSIPRRMQNNIVEKKLSSVAGAEAIEESEEYVMTPIKKRGRPKKQSFEMSAEPKIKQKVGKGLAVKETPSYREYGKYAIHIPQLEQHDILNVKYKSLGQVPKFKPIPVSDIFRDFILDLLENGKPNSRVYSQISPEERKYFEEMSIGAGVWNGLGLKRTTTSTDEEEAKRFELLKGELMAGNDNPKIVSELRRLVVKMMSDGRIRKSQGVDLLMELSI